MKQLGLLGKNIAYSFSQQYFQNKFQKEGIEGYDYQLFDCKNLAQVQAFLNTKNLVGFNVTIPYKESILPFLDDLSVEARTIGAVNTVVIQSQKKIGFNTDSIGFEQSVKPLIKKHHKKALVLGTGGASKAIVYALNRLGIESTLVSRNPNKGIMYQDLNRFWLESHTIIINCTPLGTHPKVQQFPAIPYHFIHNKHLVVDLVYNPTNSLFLQKAAKQKAITKNGLEMLHLQANAAWEIWKKRQ